MTLRTLNYGNYGIFLIMGNAGFCPSTVTYYFVGLGDTEGYGFIVGCIVNPRKLEHRFRMIHAGIPFTLL